MYFRHYNQTRRVQCQQPPPTFSTSTFSIQPAKCPLLASAATQRPALHQQPQPVRCAVAAAPAPCDNHQWSVGSSHLTRTSPDTIRSAHGWQRLLAHTTTTIHTTTTTAAAATTATNVLNPTF